MRVVTGIIAAALAAGMTGCAPEPLPVGQPAAQNVAYTVGAGDKVRLTTFGFEDFSGEFIIAADKSLSLPMVGPIQVGGLTPSELETRVASALAERGIVRNPRVAAEVVEYRPYYILGEVGKPGQYPFTNGLTVMKAVATAQGFTYRANSKVVFITRDDGNAERMELVTPSTPVGPGDTIRVAERRL